jgi:hypothetical protein
MDSFPTKTVNPRKTNKNKTLYHYFRASQKKHLSKGFLLKNKTIKAQTGLVPPPPCLREYSTHGTDIPLFPGLGRMKPIFKDLPAT